MTDKTTPSPRSPSSSSLSGGAQSSDALELGGALWLRAGDQTLAGAARIALLAAIHETGSITAAAKAVGLSYKAAWDAVDAMNNLAGEALVVRATGGKGGGGTTLTARALRLIETFRIVEREHRHFIERAAAAIDGFSGDWALIGRIGMKTSARNQLYGKVTELRHGAVNDEVVLTLPGGQEVVAIITHESTQALRLAVGGDVVALVKASWVLLAVDELDSPQLRLSARNQLRGKVTAVAEGAVNAEVAIELDSTDGAPGGPVLTAIVTNESAVELGLEPGKPAIAAFKASSVILGTAD